MATIPRFRDAAVAVLALCTLLLPALAMTAEARQRPEVLGTQAAVTAGHPLAAAAGADVLRRGGNAVDAAITMAAVLAVVRPHMNGVGGDNFLLIRDAATGEVHALNGSGRAGSGATPARFADLGLDAIPTYGAAAVTVPGAVRAWEDALTRFGTISLAEALAPAIGYAADGFPVSRKLAADITEARDRIVEDATMAAAFLADGEPPRPGTRLIQPDLARTLRAIADGGADAFYAGEPARRIAAFMEAEGGLLTGGDLASHVSTWDRPLETTYRGYRVLAFPPNTQGPALLMQLNLAEHFELAGLGHNTAPYIHTLVEMKKLAFADRDRYITDPEAMRIDPARLVSKEHARERLGAIGDDIIAGAPATGPRRDGEDNTVYLAAVDADGNAVSLIQSLFHSFGSGRMVPGTGIVLQNRGASFSLDAQHVNVLAAGKRPYHTLIPAMALRPDGSLFLVFGTPGGDGQTQTQVQILQNLLLFGMTPQEAIEAPRWRSYDDGVLAVEPGISEEVRDALAARGHQIRVVEPGAVFGGAQVILVDDETGVMLTGADHRREAQAVAW